VTTPPQRRFVVQEHFARTHHEDFRLQWEGVFKSWVLRKPIPRTPGIRRLAIRVEDHDLSFGDFEGEIPQGEYGAGKIKSWDTGGVVVSRWTDQRITFQLAGDRLGGTYTLTRFPRVFSGTRGYGLRRVTCWPRAGCAQPPTGSRRCKQAPNAPWRVSSRRRAPRALASGGQDRDPRRSG